MLLFCQSCYKRQIIQKDANLTNYGIWSLIPKKKQLKLCPKASCASFVDTLFSIQFFMHIVIVLLI